MNFLSQVVDAVKRGDSIPTEPKWVKWIHRNLSPNHCPGWMVYPNGQIQLTTPYGGK